MSSSNITAIENDAAKWDRRSKAARKAATRKAKAEQARVESEQRLQNIFRPSDMTDDEWRSGLNSALQACVFDNAIGGKGINHPLCHHPVEASMLHPSQLNRWYAQTVKLVDKFKSERDWSRYITLVAKPYRLEALLSIEYELTDRQFWQFAGDVWEESENIWQYKHDWLSLFMSDRPHREHFMTRTERNRFKQLPNIFRVYRGATELNKAGMSWTLSKETAEMFLTYNSMRQGRKHQGMIYEMQIPKSAAFAYKNGRNEQEIICPTPQPTETK